MSGVKSSYDLAKFLVPLLEPINTNTYTVKSSFEFAKESVYQDPGLFRSSQNVEALFINMPLEEIVNVCCDSLFSNYAKVNNINKIDLQNF